MAKKKSSLAGGVLRYGYSKDTKHFSQKKFSGGEALGR